LVGVDQAQAALLTYDFTMDNSVGSGFLKVSNSSLKRIGLEEVAVSEGILNTILIIDFMGLEGKKYYNLAGATALFYEGDFRGLQAGDGDFVTREIIIPSDEPNEPFYLKLQGGASWSIGTNQEPSDMWRSYFYGYKEVIAQQSYIVDRAIVRDTLVSYTLVDTEPEPVPEPLTAGGTALALAGLSWLKHKKKMAA
jgi:hypothetical protein